MFTVKPHMILPVQVAYVWAVAFAILLFIVPFMWYGLNMAVTTLQASVTSQFSDVFNDELASGANMLFVNLWTYMPVLMAVAVLLWAIMHTLKERRAGMIGYA